MTNREIVNVLDDITWNGCGRYKKEVMIESRATAIKALEENDKLKAEIEQLRIESNKEKLDDAFDLGYQTCLRHNGLSWDEAEELQKCRKEIEEIKSRWIPCSKRLPEEGKVEVLNHHELDYMKSDEVWVTFIYENQRYISLDYTIDGEWVLNENVIAWCELPEPYKGEE